MSRCPGRRPEECSGRRPPRTAPFILSSTRRLSSFEAPPRPTRRSNSRVGFVSIEFPIWVESDPNRRATSGVGGRSEVGNKIGVVTKFGHFHTQFGRSPTDRPPDPSTRPADPSTRPTDRPFLVIAPIVDASPLLEYQSSISSKILYRSLR